MKYILEVTKTTFNLGKIKKKIRRNKEENV